MTGRRRILLYTHGLTGGGAERVCALLASGLARRGHKVALAVDFPADQNAGFLDPAVRLIVLGGGHFISVIRLARLLAREKPDASLSALSVSNLKHTAAAFMAGRLSRAVLSYHGYSASEPQFLSRLGYFATAALSRSTAALVCVSEGLRDYVVGRWRADPSRAKVIYNPVDPGPGIPAATEAELLSREPVVLASGRLVSYKAFPRLVRAFAKVSPATAKLVILGEGVERPRIEAEIARLGLGGRVQLVGYVREPWDWYRKAACFVLPSESETFGLVLVEALGNGLPVVAMDCHGPREILADGEYGQIVAQDDEDGLAAAISRALGSPGDPGPRIARAKEFSLDRGLDAYEALFEQVIAGAERGPQEKTSPVKSPAASHERALAL